MKHSLKELPISLKMPLLYTASIIPKNLLESKEYQEFRNFLSISESWDSNHIEEFQSKQLQLLVKHAYENVLFYKETFDAYGINVGDIKDKRDLKRLPLIDKKIVQENREKFIAKNFNYKKLTPINTGGTTSSPLHFFNTKTTNNREVAFFDRIWEKYGYNGQRCLVMRGNIVNDDKLFQYNPFRKHILINTRNFNVNNFDGILEVIERYNPPYIQAYPSLIYLFSKYINGKGLSRKVGNFKAIFCSSEKMYQFQRDEIIEAFGVNVIDYYGHNERLALMEYCPKCQLYHVIPEYGIVEFLNNKRKSENKEEHLSEIVGTGFNNYAFPLIRYKTSDMVTLAGENLQCKSGGLYSSVKEIDGRSGDFIVTVRGEYYSPTVVSFAFDYIKNFNDMQLIQKSYSHIDLLIVPNEFFNISEGHLAIKELKNILGSDININLKLVDQIDKPLNSKHRFIVSNIH
ncbi:phenylacetate--CoA ligase family protein [Paenibacillus sp. BSR1-1]|uniref:phenylacetate--CoA ligase family protein n=1 Tax=Paenibacillus sp. BSR1-1 TaxID=3020845 RepID=UPI0025AFF3C7|nr:phenylacetate--CoA ligase family protein [Paenibacillus sp. BSR1-1]MDN3019178.1 phenylacetate--CoA ligase family protein [Paenibacillus sp. BSR1-1]